MIVQEFIDGPEIRLTFINASGGAALPKFGYNLIDCEKRSPSFISFGERDGKYNQFRDFKTWSELPVSERAAVIRRMQESISRLARHIQLKDYFAFDFRLDSQGIPWMVDFNPGAFLCGDDVEGYTKQAFGLSLPSALHSAMINGFSKCQPSLFGTGQIAFRL
jgi:hypothetical protein